MRQIPHRIAADDERGVATGRGAHTGPQAECSAEEVSKEDFAGPAYGQQPLGRAQLCGAAWYPAGAGAYAGAGAHGAQHAGAGAQQAGAGAA